MQSAAAQATAQVPKGAVYPGGWLAGNWHEQLFRGELTLALLYYPALLVHDPLADFFFRDYGSLPPTRELRERRNRMTISGGPAVWGQAVSYEGMRSNPDAVLDYLVKVITFLVDAAPLLRSSALITRSQWPTILDRSQALMTSVRNDVRSREMQSAVAGAAAAGDPVPTWDNIRGLNVLPVGGLRASDEPWQWQHEFFYLAKTLAVADAVGATYAPPTNGDLAVLRVKVAQAQRAVVGDRQPRELLAEVLACSYPTFSWTRAPQWLCEPQRRRSTTGIEDCAPSPVPRITPPPKNSAGGSRTSCCPSCAGWRGQSTVPPSHVRRCGTKRPPC